MMKLFHEVVMKVQSSYGYRRISHVAIRSVRTERHAAIRMAHVIIRSVRTEGACSLRRITHVVVRSKRTEGGCRCRAHWMSEILNHLEMIEIGSHHLTSFSLHEGCKFLCEGWCH